MPDDRTKGLIAIYEENISGILASLGKGKGGPRKQELRRFALARLLMKLERAKAGSPLPTYAEKTRRKENRYYAF